MPEQIERIGHLVHALIRATRSEFPDRSRIRDIATEIEDLSDEFEDEGPEEEEPEEEEEEEFDDEEEEDDDDDDYEYDDEDDDDPDDPDYQ